MSKIVLEVSLGEALDKLTILDIKIDKIKDERRNDCVKEYNVLYNELKEYVEKFPYHYKILKQINLTIWNLQDNIHKDTNLTKTYGEVLRENDRRFRVKKKINEAANSNLKEQKGYAKTKAFIYHHLGLGDFFWMNGSVRYLSTCYDEIVVVCKKNNEAVVRSMYADDSSIKLFVINDDMELYPFVSRKIYFEDEGYKVYSCGYHSERRMIYDFPYSFYDDMDLSREIRTNYFYVAPYIESYELYKEISDVERNYILIHQKSSTKTIDLYTKLQTQYPNTLILDINENHYNKDHPFHYLAGFVVNKPMLYYKELAENAKEIHCLESSFYCFVSHLDLSKVEKKMCYDPFDNSAQRIGVFNTAII
uniref:Uncharacterized protein n=1 Tax=viral metagenome TaxID=1070528 RepID=A0A6C0D9E3_9ZZZZ